MRGGCAAHLSSLPLTPCQFGLRHFEIAAIAASRTHRPLNLTDFHKGISNTSRLPLGGGSVAERVWRVGFTQLLQTSIRVGDILTS